MYYHHFYYDKRIFIVLLHISSTHTHPYPQYPQVRHVNVRDEWYCYITMSKHNYVSLLRRHYSNCISGLLISLMMQTTMTSRGNGLTHCVVKGLHPSSFSSPSFLVTSFQVAFEAKGVCKNYLLRKGEQFLSIARDKPRGVARCSKTI